MTSRTITNLLGAAAALGLATGCSAEYPMNAKNLKPTPLDDATATATLAAGCFWCVEALFQRVDGVAEVTSGYTGGHVENPTYKQVCSGDTGHAEAVRIRFDPERVSYERLLEIFFATHDPTTPNRQGADRGTQYRSAIFYHNEAQKETARKVIDRLNRKTFDDRIVTQLAPAETFYPAEDYHQDYFSNNREQPYCRIVIEPKLKKLDRLEPAE